MGNENFRFFALNYLNDWCGTDKPLHDDLRSNKTEIRLDAVQRIAKAYKISRNFRLISEDKRLDNVLIALDNMPDQITESNVSDIVNDLAARFESKYGEYAISAASKFLWFRHQTPVVIFDNNAKSRLGKLSGRNLGSTDYPKYYAKWREQFAMHSESIKAACSELTPVKDFSLAYHMTKETLTELVQNDWFHERVFDQFLWWNGSEIPQSLARAKN